MSITKSKAVHFFHHRSLGRSLARSFARTSARSIARSLARSLDRSWAAGGQGGRDGCRLPRYNKQPLPQRIKALRRLKNERAWLDDPTSLKDMIAYRCSASLLCIIQSALWAAQPSTFQPRDPRPPSQDPAPARPTVGRGPKVHSKRDQFFVQKHVLLLAQNLFLKQSWKHFGISFRSYLKYVWSVCWCFRFRRCCFLFHFVVDPFPTSKVSISCKTSFKNQQHLHIAHKVVVASFLDSILVSRFNYCGSCFAICLMLIFVPSFVCQQSTLELHLRPNKWTGKWSRLRSFGHHLLLRLK